MSWNHVVDNPMVVVTITIALLLTGLVQPRAEAATSGAAGPPDRALLISTREAAFDPFRGHLTTRLDVIEPDGSRRRLVAGVAGAGSWSPDGSQVVYGGPDGVVLIDRDGTDARVLGEGSRPAAAGWSPDGSEILMQSGVERADLLAVEVETGKDRLLHAPADGGFISRAAWSPDGTHVAYQVQGAGPTTIGVVQRDGSGDRTLFPQHAVGADRRLTWSADGRFVASMGYPPNTDGTADFTRPVIARADVATGDVEEIGVPDAALDGPLLSPDLTQYAYLDGTVLNVRMLNGEAVVLQDLGAPAPVLDLWTGEGIYVVSTSATGAPLRRVDHATGAVTVLAADVPDLYSVDNVDPSAPRTSLPATAARALHWSRQRAQGSVDTVVIARADDFADALASGGLQRSGDGQLLLTPGDELHPAVLEEIVRLGATTTVVLGGRAAVSLAVEEQLLGEGMAVNRVSGDTRLDTAVAVADLRRDLTGASPDTLIIARAFGDAEDPTRGFVDALAGGALAAGLGAPLLLSATDVLSNEVTQYLDRTPSVVRVVLLGGGAALSDGVENELAARGLDVVRLAGEGRAGTAEAIRAFGLVEGQGSPRTGSVLVPIDGGDTRAWADGFASAGIADPLRGGGVLLEGDVATWASLIDHPADVTVRCPSLLANVPCDEVVAAASTTLPPHAELGAAAEDGAVAATFRLVEGSTDCLRATMTGAVLERLVLRTPPGATPSAFHEQQAVAGRVAVCDRSLRPFGVSVATLSAADIQVEWTATDGTVLRSPLNES